MNNIKINSYDPKHQS